MYVPDDETLAANHLADLRSEARQNLHVASTCGDKPDLQGHLRDLSRCQFNTARALHRLLLKAGVKGLGPIDY